ncbi:MAG TPA: hypothetical protein VFP77_08335 [Gemmatimonadaceae bacterium]|jgi:hypothetical protein|nr:hypothetical protein [Gemmatimonadaceae bacterium]
MPARVLQIDGQQWNVYPSGYITQYTQDEYALLFSRGSGEDRQVRVTRYSPQGTRSREQAFAELSDTQLQSLFSQSQPSFTSPEAGYER